MKRTIPLFIILLTLRARLSGRSEKMAGRYGLTAQQRLGRSRLLAQSCAVCCHTCQPALTQRLYGPAF